MKFVLTRKRFPVVNLSVENSLLCKPLIITVNDRTCIYTIEIVGPVLLRFNVEITSIQHFLFFNAIMFMVFIFYVAKYSSKRDTRP